MSKDSVLTEALVKQRTKSNLAEVRKLDLWGYRLSDISLIEKMKKLEIVSLSSNNITSLKPFKSCTRLRDLFLRDNKITDFNELNYLSELPNLQILWLTGNPIASEPLYREKVMQLLPKLSKLDEDEITDFERMETLKNSNTGKRSARKVSVPLTQSFPDIEIDDKTINSSIKAKSQPLKNALEQSDNSKPHSSRQSASPNSSKLSNSSKISNSSKKSTDNIESLNESPRLLSSHQPKSSSATPSQSPLTPPEKTRSGRPNDKPLLNAILQLLPELSQESLDIILQNARKYKNK